jgi:aryl-alcohol dehydrogenase-like predicted oxidoreductase
MQMAYNLADRGNTENIRLAKERGMGVLVRCGMGNGLFTPRVLAHMDKLHEARRGQIQQALALLGGENEAAVRLLMAINLRFLYENDGISSVIVGTKRPEHIADNVALLQTPVDDALYAAVCRCFGAEV